ncbi:MAG: hypothetical protein Q9227_007372 [Pyrenula ochraceoflavens]
MKRAPVHWVNKRDSALPLQIVNYCEEDIYPGVQTQSGTGPPQTGFLLRPGDSLNQTVSADWQGRVWGRTNCSFNADGTAPANNAPGKACLTGDCGGTVTCKGTGETPASLAEFTLQTTSGQTFYDLSLVDGYNVPMGIISLLGTSGNSSLTDIPPNLTNPVCIGSAALLESAENTTLSTTFGTNSSFPLPVDQSVSGSDLQRWCPWDLQLDPPTKPGDGVYPYPDDNIQRPLFQPCLSACAKWQKDQYCCTGKYGSPGSCKPSDYSTQAKKVCPDAYSYAFDDQTSTFIMPSGGGYRIAFCPAGRSTTILSTLGDQLRQLAQTGHVSQQVLTDTQNVTLIRSSSDAGVGREDKAGVGGRSALAAVVVVAFAVGGWV